MQAVGPLDRASGESLYGVLTALHDLRAVAFCAVRHKSRWGTLLRSAWPADASAEPRNDSRSTLFQEQGVGEDPRDLVDGVFECGVDGAVHQPHLREAVGEAAEGGCGEHGVELGVRELL